MGRRNQSGHALFNLSSLQLLTIKSNVCLPPFKIVLQKAKTTVMDHAAYEKIVAQDKKEIKAAKKEVATPTGKIALKSLKKATEKMEKLAKSELKGDKKLRRM